MGERMAVVSASRELWDETFGVLLAQARRPVEETDREIRDAVWHAFILGHGDPTEDELNAPATQEMDRTLKMLTEARDLGWRDAPLGAALARYGYQVQGRHGWPHSLWGAPARTAAARGFRRTSMGTRAFSLRERLARPWGTMTHVVNDIREVDRVLEDVPRLNRSMADVVREAVTRLSLADWHRDIVVEQRRGWDDAPWHAYLGLDGQLPWLAVALGLPGDPDRYADLDQRAAFRTVGESWESYGSDELPPAFIEELVAGCVQLANGSTDQSGADAAPDAPSLHIG
jgi:hypothetical protein